MRLQTTLTTLASLVLAATALTSCGGSDTEAYCDELKADKSYFDSLDSGDGDLATLEKAADKMDSLSEAAPDDVADDWKKLTSAMDTIQQALADAGLEQEDLTALQNGQMPEGVDMAKLQELSTKMDALNSDDVEKAADNIEKHAKDECNIDLSES